MAQWIEVTFFRFNLGGVQHSLTREPVNEEEFNTITYDWFPKVTWTQYQEASASVKNFVGIGHIRQLRDQLLKQSDWVITPDHFNLLSNQNDWIAYRQALRDLPESGIEIKWMFGNQVDFDNMNMPIKPSLSTKITTTS